MDSTDRELLDFLRSSSAVEHRRALYQLLDVPVDDPSVFYIVALPNLAQIAASGGISCRNRVSAPAVELSSHEIQGRRDRLVPLKGRGLSGYKSIHDCVNLFWNPINNTLHAFRRNALFAAHAGGAVDESIATVCILRISLESLFASANWRWSVTSGNLAGMSQFGPTSDVKQYGEEEWPWNDVYNGDAFAANRTRAAELLVHGGGEGPSQHLPLEAVTEVIVEHSTGARVRAAVPTLAARVRQLDRQEVFRGRDSLLHNEIKAFTDLWRLAARADINPRWLGTVVRTFPEAAGAAAGPMHAGRFSDEYVAAGPHGVGHVTRVMFWSFVLSLQANISAELMGACLLAAALHDLRRFNNDAEPEHGRLAAEAFAETVRAQLSPGLADQVLEAVEFHSRADEEYETGPLNPVWQVLKDADALDRGRFGSPWSSAEGADSGAGCDTSSFRLAHLKDFPARARELAWFAFRLSAMTQHAPWHVGNDSAAALRIRIAAAAGAALPFMDARNDRARLQGLLQALLGE